MATVYVIYSPSLDSYYTGSCNDIAQRLQDHNSRIYRTSYTARATDWQEYFLIDNLEYSQARKIEAHIKRMKSRQYIERLRMYPVVVDKLKSRYP